MFQLEREKTKGDKWFNMPATEIPEERKHDLEVLRMRKALDPKRFYKANDLKTAPKYFQVGYLHTCIYNASYDVLLFEMQILIPMLPCVIMSPP